MSPSGKTAANHTNPYMENKKVIQTRVHNIELCMRQRDSPKIEPVGKVTIVEV